MLCRETVVFIPRIIRKKHATLYLTYTVKGNSRFLFQELYERNTQHCISLILCRETVAFYSKNYTKETRNTVSHLYCEGKQSLFIPRIIRKKHATLCLTYTVKGNSRFLLQELYERKKQHCIKHILFWETVDFYSNNYKI
jgi:peptidase E